MPQREQHFCVYCRDNRARDVCGVSVGPIGVLPAEEMDRGACSSPPFHHRSVHPCSLLCHMAPHCVMLPLRPHLTVSNNFYTGRLSCADSIQSTFWLFRLCRCHHQQRHALHCSDKLPNIPTRYRRSRGGTAHRPANPSAAGKNQERIGELEQPLPTTSYTARAGAPCNGWPGYATAQ